MISANFGDAFFMRKALNEAHLAFEEDEVPVGALVVLNNQIIGKGYNQVEKLNDVTAHAELLAITAASNYLGSKYLTDCTLYVTLEPCMMCATAINLAQISNVVYGAKDPKRGYSIYQPMAFNKKTVVRKNILEKECGDLLIDFFKQKRK